MNRNVITVTRAGRLIEWMAGETMHAKRVQSVTNAVVGVVNAVSLSIHAIGAGLAQATGLNAKHTIKQVDRLLSNSALNVWALFAHWVPYALASSRAIVVALDWTNFDADGHSTIALYLITAHGRATPLVWMSVKKARLKGRRNVYEDAVLVRLHEVLPPAVQVTVLADRGFGDQKLYALLEHLGFAFIIRFGGVVTVESHDGEVRPASEWVPPNGQVRHLQDARVTTDRYALDEETFRGTKDPRYGLGWSATHVREVGRRDRLLLVCAMAMTLLTVLGAAGESLGMDRMLKCQYGEDPHAFAVRPRLSVFV